VVGVPACAGVAMVAAWLTSLGLAGSGLPPAIRFMLVAVVLMIVFGVLLAYFQGISPRTIAAALSSKGKPGPPHQPPPEDPSEGAPPIA
jgi:hypothetical protein